MGAPTRVWEHGCTRLARAIPDGWLLRDKVARDFSLGSVLRYKLSTSSEANGGGVVVATLQAGALGFALAWQMVGR